MGMTSKRNRVLFALFFLSCHVEKLNPFKKLFPLFPFQHKPTRKLTPKQKNRKTYAGLSWCSRIASWSHALGDRWLRLCRVCVFVHLIWRGLFHGRVGGGPCSGGDGQCIHIIKTCAGNEWGEIHVTVRHRRVCCWLWGGGLFSHDGRSMAVAETAMNVWGTTQIWSHVASLWQMFCGDVAMMKASTHAQTDSRRKLNFNNGVYRELVEIDAVP